MIEFESATTFNGLIKSFNISTNQWAAKYIFKRLKFLNSKFISHICTLLYLAMWHGWRSGYYVTFTMEFLIMKMEWEVSQRKRLCQGPSDEEETFFCLQIPTAPLLMSQFVSCSHIDSLIPLPGQEKKLPSLMVSFFPLFQVQSMIGMLRDNHKSLDRLFNSFVFKWTFTIFMKVYTLVIFGYCLVPFIMLTYNRWFPILAQFYFFAHVIYIPWQLISPCIPMKKAKSQ